MKKLSPEIAFLLLAIVFGAGFLMLTPPFQAPDEAFHLFRSWEISQGRLGEITESGQTSKEVPKSFVAFLTPFLRVMYHSQERTEAAEILQFRGKTLDAENTQSYAFISTAPHPPFPYFPQTIAMLAGRALRLSPFSLFYLGRLLNFLIWLSLVYHAIKFLPIFRWVFTVLALSPMSLHQAASLSPDAMTNALAFLLIAWVLKVALTENESPRIKTLGGAVLASLYLAISKLVYLGHALLFFLIPRKKFSSSRSYILGIGTIIGVHVLAVWLLLHGENFASRPETQYQSHWILHHPLGYLKLLAKTFRFLAWPYLRQYVGSFGHLDTPLPNPLVLFYLFFLGFVVYRDRGPARNLHRWEKAFLVSIGLFEILAILSSIFITWTRPGTSIVLGVQGRYFIPVMPLLLLPFYRSEKTGGASAKWLAPLCLYALTMILTVSLFVLKTRFY